MRTTIKISDDVARIAGAVAERDFRGNFSHVCEVALKTYCEPRALDGVDAEVLSYARAVGTKRAIAALKSAARAKRAA